VIHNESLFLDSCSSFRMLWPGYSPEPKKSSGLYTGFRLHLNFFFSSTFLLIDKSLNGPGTQSQVSLLLASMPPTVGTSFHNISGALQSRIKAHLLRWAFTESAVMCHTVAWHHYIYSSLLVCFKLQKKLPIPKLPRL